MTQQVPTRSRADDRAAAERQLRDRLRSAFPELSAEEIDAVVTESVGPPRPEPAPSRPLTSADVRRQPPRWRA
jgi:hypothetical protein